LKQINKDGQGNTNLVLNGDTFELWQSLAMDCIHPDKDLGCTEKEELTRSSRVLAQHRLEMASLKEFAESGQNRVIFVPGNHDVGLIYPAVQSAVLNAVGAKKGTVRIARDGYWTSGDGAVYADHGQQIGNDTNRFDCWPNPLIERDGVSYLQRPWGEQFVQRFFNEHEARFPLIDNLSDESEAIRLAVKSEGPSTTVDALQFTKFILLQDSWKQTSQWMGKQKANDKWNAEDILKSGDKFIVQSFAPDDPLLPAITVAYKKGTLPIHTADLSADEINEICDRRALIRKKEERTQNCDAGECIALCPSPAAGAAVEALFNLREKHFRAYLIQVADSLKTSHVIQANFQIYVYSHTHIAEAPDPLRGFARPWDLTVANTGAWQRVASDEQLDKIETCRGLKDEQVLAVLKPEDLPACYSAVTIDYPYNKTSVHLVYWQQDQSGDWILAPHCNWRCTSAGTRLSAESSDNARHDASEH
jgi:3',5'-cyclic AMP phosphodiesterase CpdA